MPNRPSPEEIRAKALERRQQILAGFPFERVEAAGGLALATWQECRQARRGYPVVLGDDEAVVNIAEHFNFPHQKSVDEIVTLSNSIRHPEDLVAKRISERQKSLELLRSQIKSRPDAALPKIVVDVPGGKQRELTREETIAAMLREPNPPPLGEWPTKAPSSSGLSVNRDYRGVYEKVHIAIIPTDDWTIVPAHLRWGGWNACPAPEYHVAALRAWRDRYGAELVGLSFDVMTLKVARQPQAREQAIELAREHYAYCNDIIDQGVGTLSNLAAALMANDWWYFWWD